MGYQVSLEYSNVVLKKEQHEEILNTWVDFKETKIKPENRRIKNDNVNIRSIYDFEANTMEELLENMDVGYEKTSSGDFKLKEYNGKCVLLSEFLEKIANFIPKDSMMLWIGEDGSEFVWVFNGKTLSEDNNNNTVKLLLKNLKSQEEDKNNQEKKENRYKNLL